MVKQCWSDWDKDNERNGLGKINFRNGADIWSRSYVVAIAYGMWMIAGLLVITDFRSLPFSYPKMYAFLPFFFVDREGVYLGVRKRVKPKMTRVSVLGTEVIIEIFNKREFAKSNLPGLIYFLFYILVKRFLSVLTTKFFLFNFVYLILRTLNNQKDHRTLTSLCLPSKL